MIVFSLLLASVESLQTVPVKSYQEIDAKMQQGTKNRTVASTNMNATSRSDTEVPLCYTEKLSEYLTLFVR